MISLILNFVRLFQAVGRSWSQPEFRATLVLAGVTLLSGTVFYHNVEGWGWLDSLYFSTTTISTVGFGDLSPQTQVGKFFTIVYIFVGVGVFVALFSLFAKVLIRPDHHTDDHQ